MRRVAQVVILAFAFFAFAHRLPAPIHEETTETDAEWNSGKIAVIFAPKPEYPLAARKKHLEGDGVLLLHIDMPSGNVTSVDVEKSTGHKILDNAAVRSFLRWRFRPGTYTKVRVPIHYSFAE
jgi:TonB family protein